MLLLTGATGLVGSALLRSLVAKGADVRCLVRDPRRLETQRVRVQIALGGLGIACTAPQTRARDDLALAHVRHRLLRLGEAHPALEHREKPAGGRGRQLVRESDPGEIASLLRERPRANVFVVTGALSERFLEGLLGAGRERPGRKLRLNVQDAPKVFLSRRAPSWYMRRI